MYVTGCALVALLCLHGAAASSPGRYDIFKGGYGSEPSYEPHKTCPAGFRPDDDGGCIDDDECRKHPIITCGLNADCFNLPGSFHCACRPGYEKNKYGHCVDVNECKADYGKSPQALCSKNENCFNQIGSYACLCKAGFVRDKVKGCKKIGGYRNDAHSGSYGSPSYPPARHPNKPKGYGPSPPKVPSYGGAPAVADKPKATYGEEKSPSPYTDPYAATEA